MPLNESLVSEMDRPAEAAHNHMGPLAVDFRFSFLLGGFRLSRCVPFVIGDLCAFAAVGWLRVRFVRERGRSLF